MTVDISRVRFDSRNNYAWTIEQQGRVRLDADSLEGEAIQDRRWRSETFDILDRVADEQLARSPSVLRPQDLSACERLFDLSGSEVRSTRALRRAA